MSKIGDSIGGALEKISVLRPQVSRKRILEISILSMIFLIAIAFRVMKGKYGAYMDAFDPLFQYRVTEYIVENGYSAWFTWHDTLSWYPFGRDIATSSYPGIPFTAAFVYQVLHFFGSNISVYNVCLYFPAFMGAITCIAMYYLGKELGGTSVGLIASFFMAISEVFLRRTALGFFDTENIGIFGMVLTAFFFLRSISEKNPSTHKIIYAILGGLSLGYIFASWGAARYAVGILIVYIIGSIVTNLYNRQILVSSAIVLAVGLLFAISTPFLGLKYLKSAENIGAILLLGLLVVYEVMKTRIDGSRVKYYLLGLVLVAALGVFTLEAFGIITPISGKFLNVLLPFSEQSAAFGTVAEHKVTTWNSFFESYGVSLALGIFGTFISLKQIDQNNLMGASLFVSSLYFAGVMHRLGLIFSISVNLMAAYGLTLLIIALREALAQKTATRRSRKLELVGISKELAAIFTILILLTTFPIVWSTNEVANVPTQLAASGIAPGVQDWLQALNWMKDNVPEEALVVSWWDYGYWIEALSERTTMADGYTINGTHMGEIGKMFLFNETESLPKFQYYNASYVVVHPTYYEDRQVGQGDQNKWAAMAVIAGLNASDYYRPDETGQYEYTETYDNSVLNKLLRKEPMASFELVYQSTYSFVLVYRINYP